MAVDLNNYKFETHSVPLNEQRHVGDYIKWNIGYGVFSGHIHLVNNNHYIVDVEQKDQFNDGERTQLWLDHDWLAEHEITE